MDAQSHSFYSCEISVLRNVGVVSASPVSFSTTSSVIMIKVASVRSVAAWDGSVDEVWMSVDSGSDVRTRPQTTMGRPNVQGGAVGTSGRRFVVCVKCRKVRPIFAAGANRQKGEE